MKFMLFVLPTVPGTLEDRKRLRPIGRNNERYQQMGRYLHGAPAECERHVSAT
jgi:hypothetical protein